MTQEGWKYRVIKAVRELNEGDEASLDLLSRYLEEIDHATQLLREKGYGYQGLSLLEMIETRIQPALNYYAQEEHKNGNSNNFYSNTDRRNH